MLVFAEVDTDGNITTVAGSGIATFGADDGGAATAARISPHIGIAIDSAGNLLIRGFHQ